MVLSLTDPPVAVSSAFLVLGLVLTIFRLTYRIWLRRFWVEDAWAGVAFLCGIVALTSCWTYVAAGKGSLLVHITHSSLNFCLQWAKKELYHSGYTHLLSPLPCGEYPLVQICTADSQRKIGLSGKVFCSPSFALCTQRNTSVA